MSQIYKVNHIEGNRIKKIYVFTGGRTIDKDSYSSGQPVEIYITLFEQSVISYLIGPIKTFFNNTFNE